MSESTLSITRVEILSALRRYLTYARTGTLETDQQSDIDDYIRSGENAFYKGTRLPGEQTVHRWSFLEPEFSLSVTAADNSYDLPDDFGGIASAELMASLSGRATEPVKVVSIDRIRRMQAEYPTYTTEFPLEAAPHLKSRAQTTGQRFELIIWPTPTLNHTLIGTYFSNPSAILDATPYPLGGQPHGLTLKMACLAAAERDANDIDQGPYFKEFMRMMFDSVAFDRALTTPKYFGQNLDRSRPANIRRHRGEGVTYNGMV